MLFSLLINSASASLLTKEYQYINYESAVNPEYFDKNIKPYRKSEIGSPVVHRKLGLGKGNQKLVSEIWLKTEFEKFQNFLEDLLCLQKKMCDGKPSLQTLLKRIKSQNDKNKDELFNIVSDPEFDLISTNITEIIQKYFDIGYCNFKDLKDLVLEVNSFLMITRYDNKSKFDEMIEKLINCLNIIQTYEDQCISKNDEVNK